MSTGAACPCTWDLAYPAPWGVGTMQEVPGVTPVALLGRGLAAICRKLAAGSPAVQVCVNLLEERTGQLLQEASGSECRASPAFTPPATSITGSAPGAARGGRWSPSSAARPASGAGGAHGPGPTHLSTDSQCSAPPPVTELRQLLLLLLHLVSVVDIQVRAWQSAAVPLQLRIVGDASLLREQCLSSCAL